MGTRYFSATVMGGKLYVQGIGERGPWDSQRLMHWPEQAVDQILQPLAGERKVRTAGELQEAILASTRGLPNIKVWIHEAIESVAREMWASSRVGK